MKHVLSNCAELSVEDTVYAEFGDGWGELEIGGCRPMHFAAGNGHRNCVEVLIDAGAKGYNDYASWEGGSHVVPLPLSEELEYDYGMCFNIFFPPFAH